MHGELGELAMGIAHYRDGHQPVLPINRDISFVNNRYRPILTTNNNRDN